MKQWTKTPHSFRKYQRNSENLRKFLQVGMLLPAKILGNPLPGLFLILVKNEKILANSNISFSNSRIIVQVKAKKPKLLLKLIPFYGESNLDRLIDFSNKYNVPLDKNNQKLIGHLLNNRSDFKTKNYSQISASIFKIAELFDNYLILSQQELFNLYQLGDKNLQSLLKIISNKQITAINESNTIINEDELILQVNSLLKKSIIAKNTIEISDFGYNIFYFKRIDKKISKYQFIIETELYGKLNIFCYFEDNMLSIKFFSLSSFTKEFIDSHLPQIKQIVDNFGYELILANLEIISPITVDKGIFLQL